MKRKLFAVLVLVGVLVTLPLSPAQASAQASQTTNSVTLISDPSTPVGSSTLTRTSSGIAFSLQTPGLPPATR